MTRRKKRNEQGSIVTREEGRKYLLRWTEDGKRHSQIVRGDYVEAMSALTKKLRPTDEAPKIERTFASYMEQEWAQYQRDHWKASTQTTYGSYVTQHIRPYFDDMTLTKIVPSDVVSFHAALETKGLSKQTRRTLHAILTTMFSHALELELIPKTPIKKKMAPKADRTEKPTLTPEQAWELWDALSATAVVRHKAYYGVLLFTGIRTGEGLGLKWEDIDFASRVLTIKREIYRGKETTPKTKASLRTRPMSDDLYTALLHHKAMATVYNKPTDYVFASSTGRPLNPDKLRAKLQDVLRSKLGIHLAPRQDGLHLLRHTSGSLLFRATGSVKETQAWLGHSSARITLDTYVHLISEGQKATTDVTFKRPSLPLVAPEEMS